MGLSELSEHGCKKHPHHQAKQGVCPSCLRESLSRLCSSAAASTREASRVAPSTSSSLSFSPAYYYSSAASSNSASPAPKRHRFHKRNGSDVMGSLSFIVRVGNGLKKSRSIAFVPRNLDDIDHDGKQKQNKKKKGFWSKLLGFKGNKKHVLRHSTSLRFI